MSTATAETPTKPRTDFVRLLLTNRTVLLLVLLVLVVGIFSVLSAAGVITEGYNSDYLASSLINLVPLTMLALAQLLVIVSGNGGIDLSVGAIVSLAGMLFGFMYGVWGWSLLVSIVCTVLCGALFGLINGFLVAYLGYPPLIVTLATYYAMWSLSLVINNQQPINTPPLQDLYGLSRAVELPVIGQYLPLVPLGVFLFMIPTLLIVWFITAKTTYGRELYAIGTNDTAAGWAGINTQLVRMLAYVGAGAISGLVAVVTASQFASARPDQGVSGNGMALPAITMAVLGGVAITGGIGTVLGVFLAALLITWLNAGILMAFSGNAGSQLQLFALGAVLVGAALLNGITNRRYSGSNN
ncbi:ABC transporter permease [Tessaracoccus sp. MC1865]|uniref:ABC transporter permease n=1 Tax=Tessaracoccus sp. MC1865 TaxID=2760310 RepID=UPI0016000052|nr:ABC transporter permease [Tessaracoccus sp. MC1865]MBB1484151.1 ABC transporter permease [Tessaracoccus sp. MC1865]QTO37177.1 ABC transporter permease [Tessaracoccus sp. MC1865]